MQEGNLVENTIHRLLERAASFPGAGIRLLDRDEKATWLPWSEIRKLAMETAGGLAARGVGPGERVAIILPTGIDFLRALFGTLLAGAVPVPLCSTMRFGQQEEYALSTALMLQHVNTRLVLVEERIRRQCDRIASHYRPPLGFLCPTELSAHNPPQVLRSPSDLALVLFSSGTTRNPMPVALSHSAIVAQGRALNSYWPDNNRVRHSGVCWLPLYHDMGLIGCVFPALERPATLTLMGPETFIARPSAWLRTISTYHATISPAPNFALELALTRIDDEEIEDIDLSSWCVAPIGAETVSPATLRAFQHRFSRWGLQPTTLTPVYGLSEAALAVTFSDVNQTYRIGRYNREALWKRKAIPDQDGLELVSVGKPIPEMAVCIRDGKRNELPELRIGHIWASGPSLMTGYLNQPRRTSEVMDGSWLDTGDLGFVDNGELFITGRAKDIVIVRGRNYDPAVLESAVASVLENHRGFAVAVSRPADDSHAEQLLMFIEVPRRVSAEIRQNLKKRCSDAVLASAGVMPNHIIITDCGALPRTSSGKLRRRETLRRYELGELQAPQA